MDTELWDQLHRMPKVELHRHLEGSLRPKSVFYWLKKINYPLPVEHPGFFRNICQVLKPMSTLEAVLQRFEWVQRAFVSLDAVESLTYEVCEDCAEDNVRLVELRFSPDFLTQPFELDWDQAMERIVRSVQRAEQELDITVGLIVIATRELGLESAKKTVEFALKWKDHLVGFDLAGSEDIAMAEDLKRILEPIYDTNLGITIHSGESTSAEHIRVSVEQLGARRIGHGIRIVEDPNLVDMLARLKVAFEVCPTSNLRIGAVDDYISHPIREMDRSGLVVTINSDDPGLFDIRLTDDFYHLVSNSLFTVGDIVRLNRQAYAHSFIAESRKKHLYETYLKKNVTV